MAQNPLSRRAALLAPSTASSVAHVPNWYAGSLRPCEGTSIAPLRRGVSRQALLTVDPAHDLLTGAIETAHHGPLVNPKSASRFLVREAGDVDGDEDVAEVVR
jgi:hypothetical protein